ncbi:biotin--[acetyl-CoA-carboxylase] ligase [Moraxella oblonga]|uniref:biotin--[acetyl-CoA-carboxylase] ligase n=1 Tax=Moraxella oblonga TaxID=200413 RepID=UPI00083635CC|nr:biotin--[acetyl-CoA-carboxylase] ligase [Moraxella oblonga]
MPHFLTPTTHTHAQCTGSTNTDLIRAIADGIHQHHLPHLYTTDHQTAGRGQHGRSWISGANNVFLSLYIPIGHKEFDLSQLSGLLSLAVGHQIAHLEIIQTINQTYANNQLPPIGVKWANDVGFYDNQQNTFKKLAGILIEPVFKKINDKNTLVGVVVGVGLNVNHTPMIQDGLYQATCLKDLKPDLNLSAHELYIPMSNAIFKSIQICNACQDKNELNIFINEFNKIHLLHNKSVHIFIQNNMTDIHANGICVGIGNHGELLLKNNDEIIPIYAGMAKIEGNF